MTQDRTEADIRKGNGPMGPKELWKLKYAELQEKKKQTKKRVKFADLVEEELKK